MTDINKRTNKLHFGSDMADNWIQTNPATGIWITFGWGN